MGFVVARDIECDILVLGGGLGGVAAALSAARSGYRVCLTEENKWLGGQCTAQGVSALDENSFIEYFSGTRSYYEFRDRIRAIYRENFQLTADTYASSLLNPGGGWASSLCFEPRVGLGALLHMLLPEIDAERLEIFYGARIQAAHLIDDTVANVVINQEGRKQALRFHATYLIDATELGDSLPLIGQPYITGAESREQTGEPHAQCDGPATDRTQAFTYPFAVEFCPGQNHTIAKPPDYEFNRDHQPYTLTLPYGDHDLTYKVFEATPCSPGSFWTYRRLFAADQFIGENRDLTMINWPGNNFRGGNIIDQTPSAQRQLLQQAKALSLGLLYWLQTEVPRDEGDGHGYPELRLRPDVMGTADGLSQYPYIRESRRIVALGRIVEQDVSQQFQHDARAAFFPDSCGVGHYPIDIHGNSGDVVGSTLTKPFQIPLGALVTQETTNLLAACKNIGTTHLTTGCYRLHPIEWNIGEAAGALAAFCLDQVRRPAAVCHDKQLLIGFQRKLLAQGMPLYWYEDVALDHPAFTAVQFLAMQGLQPGCSEHLLFEPERIVTTKERKCLIRAAEIDPDKVGNTLLTRADLARTVAKLRFDIAT